MSRVDFSLYLITARSQTNHRPFLPLLQQTFDAGLPALQVREKDLTTKELLGVTQDIIVCARKQNVRVIMNDRIDVAQACQTDGVHLRANSFPVSVARKLLGDHQLLGVSTHSVEEVCRAEAEGADFVVLGPVYSTPSKQAYGQPLGLKVLESAAKQSTIPIFAIGGLTVPRVKEVRQAGAFGVAVISSILSATDPAKATRAFVEALHASGS